MQVAYALPNWRGIKRRPEGLDEFRRRYSVGGHRACFKPSYPIRRTALETKLDLERLGFDCAAAVQPRCTHASKVEYQPTGPAPHGGTAPRAVKILISTALKENPVTEVSVQKTNETKSGPK